MNISQPVVSTIESVDFGFLTSAEIKQLSVKRIENSTTFDALLHPVPGGLYDSALGASDETPCATCKLQSHSCPGHAGHIELPVPVYHPIFMDQAVRLLRAKCSYCHHLRMSRAEVHRYLCKLKLIQEGLLIQAQEIEQIHLPPKRKRSGERVPNEEEGEDVDTQESDSDLTDEIIKLRLSFVRDALRAARAHSIPRGSVISEAAAEERRLVIKQFMTAIVLGRKCASCNGISPTYRKDKYVKIFEKGLTPRDYTTMVQGGFKMTNAMVLLAKERKARDRTKAEEALEIDEGIVADVESDEDLQRPDKDSDDGSDIVMVETTEAVATRGASLTSPSKTGVQRYVNCGEVHAALTLLFEKEQEIMALVYNSRLLRKSTPPVSADMLFIQTLLVPPNKYRPQAKAGDGAVAEAQQNSLYKQILTRSQIINDIHQDLTTEAGARSTTQGVRKRGFGDLQEAWVRLQDAVNSLIDRDRNPIQGAAGKQNEEGIKQKLEKKEGLFRKNMMGKRVNFAARSVISPDPNIETNQIGVPPVFAKKLTYPEPVTNHNFLELKQAVENGVDKWPGAAAIENENGQVISLRTKTLDERRALANQLLAPSSTSVTGSRNKKVHRHLTNNDVVLMNRQPTLHKPSIMGHRAKVLPGEKTIRMHYANCKTYNADFDGDEMNMHFPQNEIARAEALHIADTDHQYLVATNGEPLRGLIQDHISMGVWITNKDTLFDREDYQQLLYSCLRPEDQHTTTDRIVTVPPAILKPRALWTGKQIVSTILKNVQPPNYPGLTLKSKSTTAGDRWGATSEEGEVLFKDGEMITGILDKAQLGPSPGGLIHAAYEAFGHIIAGKLLSIFGRLLTKFLHMRAFSCGMDDLVLTRQGEEARRVQIKKADLIGLEVATKYVTLVDARPRARDPELRRRLEDILRDEVKQKGLDLVTNAACGNLSSQITKACLPHGLVKPFPQNQMQAMTGSGAKGSVVNANLISCNLGQQVLEGRRVPTMISGKTLPCFRPFETNVRAGGYIADRFLTGIRPQEYFFHCMAGREGLIDTAVKTSRSGYLQRCLIKGMEGLKVEYDDTVRDADGSMIQFLYGEDGLDVTKQKHLTDFTFMAENFMSHFAQLNVREEIMRIDTDVAREWNKAAMKAVRRGRIDAMDPVLSRYQPSSVPWSTSEAFTSALNAYMKTNPDKLLSDRKAGIVGVTSKKTFDIIMNLKYMKSVVEPGEAVGIIAGQSVGEPSTQMTLNTFHLAGHSAKNVTLGIPRLREIVMTASTHIATPTMTLYLNPELTAEDGQRFAKVLSRLTLAEIVDGVSVREDIGRGEAYESARIYAITIDFFPTDEYEEQYAISRNDIARVLETKFVPRLQKMTHAELRRKNDEGGVSRGSDAVPAIGESAGTIEAGSARPDADADADADRGGDDDEEDGDDGDATNVKQRTNRSEAISYEAPDKEEAAIARRAQREASPQVEDDVEDENDEDEGIGRSPPHHDDHLDTNLDESTRLPKLNGTTTTTTNTDTDPTSIERSSRIISKCIDCTAFHFPSTGQRCTLTLEFPSATARKLLLLPLIEAALHQTVIQSVPYLTQCSFALDRSSNTKTTTPVIHTTGVNLKAMHAYPHLHNPHLLATNDISAVLTVYGVEAARALIIRELAAVFTSHHIAVDLRHLLLIADYMTRAGGFAPFNRVGMRDATSPLQKMSFETTVAALRDAVLDRERDSLVGGSGRIVVGRVGGAGTGAVDILSRVV